MEKKKEGAEGHAKEHRKEPTETTEEALLAKLYAEDELSEDDLEMIAGGITKGQASRKKYF